MAAMVDSVSVGQGSPLACLSPRLENPDKLVSLLDLMKHARIAELIKILRNLWISSGLLTTFGDNDERARALLSMVAKHLHELEQICVSDSLDLPMTRLHIKDLFDALQIAGDQYSRKRLDLVERGGQILSNNLEKEMSLRMYFALSVDSHERYSQPLAGWEEVVSRWPKTTLDVEECSRCFAFERYAAAIFHILLVAEFGVIQVGDLLQVSGDRPGWGCVARLQSILGKKFADRSVLQQQHSKLLEEIVPMMVAVKDSSRHKISHVDNRLVWLDVDFSPNIASEVIGSVRGFMRRLAKELPLNQ